MFHETKSVAAWICEMRGDETSLEGEVTNISYAM